MIYFLLIALISYLLGSLNFGILLSRRFQNEDVREHGSGNAGATNMVRSYGKIWGVVTILGDMAKVALAILIAFFINNYFISSVYCNIDNYYLLLKSFAGLFCVIGHIFPCFFKFKGGKGVATSGGMVFMIDWRIALILLAIFFIILLTTKYVSLGSIVMALLYPVFILIFYKSALLTIIACVFTLIVVVAHRENIKRLINHTEHKMGEKKDSGE